MFAARLINSLGGKRLIRYFRSHFTLFGSVSTQRIVSVTPDAISAQAFSVPARTAACSLFALTVLQEDRP